MGRHILTFKKWHEEPSHNLIHKPFSNGKIQTKVQSLTERKVNHSIMNRRQPFSEALVRRRLHPGSMPSSPAPTSCCDTRPIVAIISLHLFIACLIRSTPVLCSGFAIACLIEVQSRVEYDSPFSAKQTRPVTAEFPDQPRLLLIPLRAGHDDAARASNTLQGTSLVWQSITVHHQSQAERYSLTLREAETQKNKD